MFYCIQAVSSILERNDFSILLYRQHEILLSYLFYVPFLVAGFLYVQ